MTAFPQFTVDQAAAFEAAKKAAVLKHYFKKGITPAAVRELIDYNILPVKLSTKRICDNPDHCSQADFFTAMMNEHLRSVVVWANRGGSKTYIVSLVSWLKLHGIPGLKISIMGGSEEQARLSGEAMREFWKIGDPYQPGYLAREFVDLSSVERVQLKNGSSVRILAASEKQARGGHPNIVILDETDVMDPKIYQSFLSQPQSHVGVPGLTWQLSTNHVMGGNMDAALEKAQANKGSIFKWCVWETMEACSGACSTCPLSPYCPGEQMKTATGYYKIDDVIQKLHTINEYTWMVEWLCLKVGSPDLVYGYEFDPDIHIINAQFDPTKMVRIAVDWGGINAFAVLAFQDFRDVPGVNAWVAVDEIYMPNSTTPAVIAEMKKRPWFANHILYAVCDHNQDSNEQLRRSKPRGIDVRLAKKDVDTGIAKVKAMLKPVLGPPRFKIARRCKNTIREFLSYKQKNGRVVKEGDHTCDAVRYFFAGLDEGDGNPRRSAAIQKNEESVSSIMR